MYRLLLLGGVAAVGFLITRLDRFRSTRHEAEEVRPRKRAKSARKRPTRRKGLNEKAPREWDEVDEASYQSFPASDPPSYIRN